MTTSCVDPARLRAPLVPLRVGGRAPPGGSRCGRGMRVSGAGVRDGLVPLVYWTFGKGFLGALTHTIARLKTYGAERVPREGGAVLACNHFAYMDPAAFGTACPRRIVYVAKIEAHDTPGLGPLIRSHGTLALRRGESDREALRRMRETVRDGQLLGMFVEGTRQRSGVPGEGKPGAAMVAIQEGRSHRPGRRVRILGVELELQPGVGRVRRADAFRDLREKLGRLSLGDRRRHGRDPAALGVPGPHARARQTGRRSSGTRRTCRRARPYDPRLPARGHGRRGRLPQRRQVDARQPPDRDAVGRGLRDARA